MTRAFLLVAAVSAMALALTTPNAARAQYDYQCADASQCPAGTACVNGTCVQQPQPQPQAQPQPQQAYPQQQPQQAYPQQQPQQAYPQQQPQGAYPQQQYGAQPQPVGYAPQQPEPRTEGRHLVGLMIAGGVVWAASYVFNGFVGAFAGAFTTCGSSGTGVCPEENEWSDFRGFGFVPLIGPWMQLAAKPTPFSQDSWGGFLIGMGILQTLGVTALILGATIEVETTVYGEGPGDGVELAILPQLAPNQGGLTLVGRW